MRHVGQYLWVPRLVFAAALTVIATINVVPLPPNFLAVTVGLVMLLILAWSELEHHHVLADLTASLPNVVFKRLNREPTHVFPLVALGRASLQFPPALLYQVELENRGGYSSDVSVQVHFDPAIPGVPLRHLRVFRAGQATEMFALQRGATEILDVLSLGPTMAGTDLEYRLYTTESQLLAESIRLDGIYTMTLRVCAGSSPEKTYQFEVRAENGELMITKK